MEQSRIRENFLYDLKRRPAGGRKRPSSAAEPQMASAPTTLSLILRFHRRQADVAAS
jgi:hypothetical protein